MKLSVFSESAYDEAAVRILVEAILDIKTEKVELPKLKSRGYSSIEKVLSSVIKHLFFQTDAEAFVVVVDSDFFPVHDDSHELPDGFNERCRLCLLRRDISQVKEHLPLQNRMPIKTAVGLAVPQIEAWYLCGIDPHVNEAAWISADPSTRHSYKSRLKSAVYGTDRSSKQLEMCAIEEARRLANLLDRLESDFPKGFGTLADDIRNW